MAQQAEGKFAGQSNWEDIGLASLETAGHTDVSYCLSRQIPPPVDSIGPHTSLHYINLQPELWVCICPVFPRRTVAVTRPSFRHPDSVMT
ncbi:uncharacterized protein ARMOST_19973 [Armillaria ostoyae]|uniref:Uncharacterized protein n=1 Tax=Armillaria ostoyae TaxID=47428 RepID=A0A284S616_ARMOS|nr:uncharacterized protein ARMOST_19973 [Armillaria ostoyae]